MHLKIVGLKTLPHTKGVTIHEPSRARPNLDRVLVGKAKFILQSQVIGIGRAPALC